MPSEARSRTLAAQWQPLIDTWRESGLSQKAYCRQHLLSYHQFVYWRRRLARHETRPAHRPSCALVPVTRAVAAPASDLSLRLPSGIELRGLTGDNLDLVQQLLGRLA